MFTGVMSNIIEKFCIKGKQANDLYRVRSSKCSLFGLPLASSISDEVLEEVGSGRGAPPPTGQSWEPPLENFENCSAKSGFSCNLSMNDE